MIKLKTIDSGKLEYKVPESEELRLSPSGLLCESEEAESVNPLTEGDDTDDFTEFEPW